MHEINNALDLECRMLTKYLIRERASEQACLLYRKAHQHIQFDFTEKENRIWKKCLRNQTLLYLTDAALAKSNPASVLRKKILLAFSILESLPEYHRHFLSPKTSTWKLGLIPFYSLRAALASLTGRVILTTIK